MISNDELQNLKDLALPVLKKAKITHSAFFGSVARGDGGVSSDVDIVIEFEVKKTLFELIDLQRELEKAFQRKVDLITRRSIYPKLRDIIKKDEVSIM